MKCCERPILRDASLLRWPLRCRAKHCLVCGETRQTAGRAWSAVFNWFVDLVGWDGACDIYDGPPTR